MKGGENSPISPPLDPRLLHADALWARHAIFLPHERLLKRMGCLITPITSHFPIKAANFEPVDQFSRATL